MSFYFLLFFHQTFVFKLSNHMNENNRKIQVSIENKVVRKKLFNCDSNFILACNFYFVTVFWLKKVSRSYINDSIQFKFSQVFYEFF